MYEVGDLIEYINRERQICKHRIITKYVKKHWFKKDEYYYKVSVFDSKDRKSYAETVLERLILKKIEVY